MIDKRIGRTRNTLINSLIELIRNKRFENISVLDITNHAGFNRGTFYIHFRDKEDLLSAVVADKLEGIVSCLRKIRVNSSDSEGKESMENLFLFVEENSHFFKVVFNENKIEDFRFQMFLTYKQFYDEINLDENIEGDETLKDFYVRFIAAASLGILIYWINDEMELSPTFMSEQLMKIMQKSPHYYLLDSSISKINRNPTKEVSSDRRIIRTKEAFKEALKSLMLEQSYDSITINDISQRADYNRVTFYSHYKNKDELYRDIINDLLYGMISVMADPSLQSNNPIPLSKLEALFSYIYANSSIFKVMYSDNKIPGFFGNIFKNFYYFFHEQFSIHGEETTIDPTIYSHYITSGLMTIIGRWIVHNMKYSPLYMAEVTTNILKVTIKDYRYKNDHSVN
jgi:AcrR family transcriptional regulator